MLPHRSYTYKYTYHDFVPSPFWLKLCLSTLWPIGYHNFSPPAHNLTKTRFSLMG